MEAEEAKVIKRYNNPLSLWNIILAVQIVAVVTLLGYWCFPAIVNLLQVVTVWFDWFRLVLRNLFFVFVFINALIGFIYVSFCKSTEKNKPDLYDEYFAAVPTVVRPSSLDYNYDDAYHNNSNYKEIVPAFKESSYRDRAVVEVNSKSYRSTRSENKTEKKARTVEYRRTESERVTKTATWKSQTMDGLSSEEFRMKVETFITEKKKMLLQQKGAVDHRKNDVVERWQNGAVDQRQNDVVIRWQNGDIEWEGYSDDGSDRHRHRSRSHRLVGGSGSTGSGSGSYLAISN